MQSNKKVGPPLLLHYINPSFSELTLFSSKIFRTLSPPPSDSIFGRTSPLLIIDLPPLILINVQYLQNVVFSFEKMFRWLRSLLPSQVPTTHSKNPSHQNFPFPHSGEFPPSLNAIWKTLHKRFQRKSSIKKFFESMLLAYLVLLIDNALKLAILFRRKSVYVKLFIISILIFH